MSVSQPSALSPDRPAILSPVLLIGVVAAVAAASAFAPPLAFLLIAAAAVVIAARHVETLCVIAFWTLPYMVVNLPTGAFTLKLPEVVAYLLAAAYVARAALRREKIAAPPATVPALVFLAVLAVAAAFSPPVPGPFQADVSPFDRNSPALRSLSIILWLGLSWLVVTALYNTAGRDRTLLWRCVRAHVLAAGVASIVSLGIYVLALGGLEITNIGGAGTARSLTPQSGNALRLAGVAYEPLFLAFYLGTTIPVTLVVMLTESRRLPTWLSGSSLLLQVCAMILTFSSGGWASVIMSLALVVPAVRRRIDPRAARRLLIGAAVFAVCLAGVLAAQQEAIQQIASLSEKISGGGDALRQGEWTAGIRMFLDRPLLGVGPGLAGYHFPEYHPNMQSSLKGLPEVNSLYLATLAESGILGFIALCWCGIRLAAAVARPLLQAGTANAAILSALAASLAGCALQYNSLNSLFLIYFCGLIGLALAAQRAEMDRLAHPAARHAG